MIGWLRGSRGGTEALTAHLMSVAPLCFLFLASISFSCRHGFLPVFAGRPVQNSKAVPVYRLAGARRAQIWGGLH